jgi:hypothetical protein
MPSGNPEYVVYVDDEVHVSKSAQNGMQIKNVPSSAETDAFFLLNDVDLFV